MSNTLNLSECLLTMGRDLQTQGRTREAGRLFQRLLRFRDLPRPVVEEAHARLTELLIADKQYRKARRHLAVLMCLRPSNGKYYFQYALTFHRDKKADPHRAAKYYQRALDIEPTKARWWAAYGKLLVEIGRTADGVAALEQAHELSPDDPVIISRLTEALCLDDRVDDARELLRDARFRNSRDARFRKLWNDFQFRRVAETQSGPRPDDPILLPYVKRAALFGPPRIEAIYRIDEGHQGVSAPHHGLRVVPQDN